MGRDNRASRQAPRQGLFSSGHHGDFLCLQRVSLKSTGYGAEEVCGQSAPGPTRERLPTRHAQMKPCQRSEPLCALRNRSPSFTSVPEGSPNPGLSGVPQGCQPWATQEGHGLPAPAPTDPQVTWWLGAHGSTFRLAEHP